MWMKRSGWLIACLKWTFLLILGASETL